jgi:hypothetical protein
MGKGIGLKEIWGKDSVGVYELAPLRRIDVIEAAKAEKCSPNDFLKEVDQTMRRTPAMSWWVGC